MAIKAVESMSQLPEDQPMPDSLLEVLKDWGCTWMWESLRLFGNADWIKGAIKRSSLVCVTDGSYIREMLPELCSAAFILECGEGTGRIVGSFPEASKVANAYRGELLGLMAIHLILLAANKVWPSLQGGAKVYSDCLGALQKVTTLPPYRIPSRCRHSDVLKNIMVNCADLTFDVVYEHVDAHQDEGKDFSLLTRPAQMNCMCDGMAKGVVWGLVGEKMPKQDMFPLEDVAVFIGEDKLSSNMDKCVRFHVHKKLQRWCLQSFVFWMKINLKR